MGYVVLNSSQGTLHSKCLPVVVFIYKGTAYKTMAWGPARWFGQVVATGFVVSLLPARGSIAGKECSPFHCYGQSNHKPRVYTGLLVPTSLIWVRLASLVSTGLHSSAGCAGKSGLYPNFWSLPLCLQVAIGVKGQIFSLCHFSLSFNSFSTLFQLQEPSWSH